MCSGTCRHDDRRVVEMTFSIHSNLDRVMHNPVWIRNIASKQQISRRAYEKPEIVHVKNTIPNFTK